MNVITRVNVFLIIICFLNATITILVIHFPCNYIHICISQNSIAIKHKRHGAPQNFPETHFLKNTFPRNAQVQNQFVSNLTPAEKLSQIYGKINIHIDTFWFGLTRENVGARWYIFIVFVPNFFPPAHLLFFLGQFFSHSNHAPALKENDDKEIPEEVADRPRQFVRHFSIGPITNRWSLFKNVRRHTITGENLYQSSKASWHYFGHL